MERLAQKEIRDIKVFLAHVDRLVQLEEQYVVVLASDLKESQLVRVLLEREGYWDHED